MSTNKSDSRATDPAPDAPESQQRRFKLISCEIIYREVCLLVGRSRHIVDVEFLRKGLHDAGAEKMVREIIDVVSAVDCSLYDAILLGYGRCNDGLAGLTAPAVPLVVPRVHDCISFFFGSARAYQGYFDQHPGTYFRSSGWTERASGDEDSVMGQLGLQRTYEQYVAQYGEDNAKFIMESLGSWTESYKYLAYMDMGLAVDQAYAARAEQEAAEKKWEFKHLEGNWGLLDRLVNGQWDSSEFLVLRPGQRIAPDDSGAILAAVNDCEKDA